MTFNTRVSIDTQIQHSPLRPTISALRVEPRDCLIT
jgi:hypothetical protein